MLPRCWGKSEVDQLKINRYLSIEEFHGHHDKMWVNLLNDFINQ